MLCAAGDAYTPPAAKRVVEDNKTPAAGKGGLGEARRSAAVQVSPLALSRPADLAMPRADTERGDRKRGKCSHGDRGRVLRAPGLQPRARQQPQEVHQRHAEGRAAMAMPAARQGLVGMTAMRLIDTLATQKAPCQRDGGIHE